MPTSVRTNPLTSTGIVVAGLLVAASIVMLVNAGTALFAHTVTVPEAIVSVAPDAAGAGRAAAQGTAPVDVTGPGLPVRLLLALAPLTQAALGLAGAWLVVGLLREIGAGRPFAAANIRRISGISILCLVSALIVPGIEAAGRLVALHNDTTLQAYLLVSPATILAGLVAAALGLAFQRGRALEDDVEGLV